MPGVAAVEVRRGDGDRELDGLVAPVDVGAGQGGQDPLADLDGTRQVTGVAQAPDHGDGRLDPDQASALGVDERLERDDRVVEVALALQGSGDQEVGKKITATVRGDELYSRSLTLPLVLLGLGLPLCFFPFAWLRGKLRDRSATRSSGGPAPDLRPPG